MLTRELLTFHQSAFGHRQQRENQRGKKGYIKRAEQKVKEGKHISAMFCICEK